MRVLTTIFLLAGISGAAFAHELGAGHDGLLQLAHQWSSIHHLPGLLLLAVAGVLVVRSIRRAGSLREK